MFKNSRKRAVAAAMGAAVGMTLLGGGSAVANDEPRRITETITGQTADLCSQMGTARKDQLQRDGYYIDLWLGCSFDNATFTYKGDLVYH